MPYKCLPYVGKRSSSCFNQNTLFYFLYIVFNLVWYAIPISVHNLNTFVPPGK